MMPGIRRITFVALGALAVAAIGDRAGAEREAAPHLRPNTYLEPFALRALALVRQDSGLLEQALVRFDGLGLEWHAEQTRALGLSR